MDNQEIRAALDKYWEATVALDLDRIHDIYHDDVIVEFPQSGERITGKHNIYELRAHYPAKLGFKVLRVRGEGSLWISEAAHSKELFDLDVLSKEYPLLWVFVLVIDHISDGTEQYFWLQYMHTLGEVSHTLISYTRPVKLV